MNNKTAVPLAKNEITHHKDRAVNAEKELTYIRRRNCADSGFQSAEFTLDSRNKAALTVRWRKHGPRLHNKPQSESG